jgi:DNA uptake protein ComE-like DNA-binding protein
MKKIIHFHVYERLGFIGLFLLTLSGFAAAQFLDSPWSPARNSMPVAEWDKALEELLTPLEPIPVEVFPFNPNAMNVESWLRLGVPEKLAVRIENYRAKGGRFRRVDDLKKIYGMPDSLYNRLAPLVRLEQPAKGRVKSNRGATDSVAAASPASFDPNEVSQEDLQNMGLPAYIADRWVKFRSAIGGFSSAQQIEKIYGLDEQWWALWKDHIRWDPSDTANGSGPALDINEADEEDWRRLKGIGPVLAGRIVRFREKLGGFAHPRQVGETYGLPDSTFRQILPFLSVSSVDGLRKISLNQAEVPQLAEHPYLNWRQAKAIANYRRHHGPFKRLEDVLETKVVGPDKLELILPYLEL